MSKSQRQDSPPALGARENFWGEDDDGEEHDDELNGMDYHELRKLVSEECGVDYPSGDAEYLRGLLRDHRSDEDDVDPSSDERDVRAEFIAHKILRKVAPKHSPITKHAPPDRGTLFDTPAPEAQTLIDFFVSTEPLEEYDWPEDLPESDPSALHTENEVVELTDPEIHVPKRYDGGAYPEQDYRQYRYRTRYDPEYGYVSGPELGDLAFESFVGVVDAVLDAARKYHSFSDGKLQSWKRDAKRMKRQPDRSDEEILATILSEMFDATDD